jgi:hypothetical protein
MELLTLYRDSRDKGSLLTVWVDEPPEFIIALLIDNVTIISMKGKAFALFQKKKKIINKAHNRVLMFSYIKKC